MHAIASALNRQMMWLHPRTANRTCRSPIFAGTVVPSASKHFEKPTPLFHGTISLRIPWFARSLGRASFSLEEHNDQT
jgi:hypothetical protein